MMSKYLEEKFNELIGYVDTIANSKLRESIKKLLYDKRGAIMNRAGSPDRIENGVYYLGDHHFFRGGLLCHLLEVTKYAVMIAETSDKQVNFDLVICGACTHDIGKIMTYEEWDDNRKIKSPSTIYANKIQHSHMGIQIVSKYLNDVNEEIKLEIYHIIGSHMSKDMGRITNGALIQPNTIEARIVCEADRLSYMLSNYPDR